MSIVALHCCVNFCCTAKWINHKYTHIYTHTHTSPFLDFLPINFTTEHWVEFPVLYSRSLLIVDFMHSISSVYVSTPVSQFIPLPACWMYSRWCWNFLLIHSGEPGDVCGARSLGEMGACCVGSAEAACLAIFSSFWGSAPGRDVWQWHGGQTRRVAFAHPQILRPVLCNHVESWCFWWSCLRVSWFMRNYLTVIVKTEECWGLRPPPQLSFVHRQTAHPAPPLHRETVSERTPPTCFPAGGLV